jgi:hypothetical protein
MEGHRSLINNQGGQDAWVHADVVHHYALERSGLYIGCGRNFLSFSFSLLSLPPSFLSVLSLVLCLSSPTRDRVASDSPVRRLAVVDGGAAAEIYLFFYFLLFLTLSFSFT